MEPFSVHLVASKLRVASLTATSISRLELMGAILELRLSVLVTKAVNIATREITFWSDSTNVLC